MAKFDISIKDNITMVIFVCLSVSDLSNLRWLYLFLYINF